MLKTMEPFRQTTNLEMEKLLKAMELFRSHDPEIPAQVISVFLYIASHDDCSKVQLQDKEVGLNMPSASVLVVILIGFLTSIGSAKADSIGLSNIVTQLTCVSKL